MATTTNFGWETPDDTDLVKDGAAAIRTVANSIDTSFVDLKGGTTGQVLAKASNTDLDYTWVAQDDSNAIQNAIVDAKGDLISATAADTPARLAVGTNGQVLTADSTTSTGLKWATPASGGKVLQVVQTSVSTSTTLTTTDYTDITSLSVSITPSNTSSKILILAQIPVYIERGNNQNGVKIKLMRGATDISFISNSGMNLSAWAYTASAAGVGTCQVVPVAYMDSPSTTSSTTYKIQAYLNYTTNSGTAVFGGHTNCMNIIALEIGA